MCGIIGYSGSEANAVQVILEGLEKLEYRGYDSAGISFLENNKIVTEDKYIITNVGFKKYYLSLSSFFLNMFLLNFIIHTPFKILILFTFLLLASWNTQ